MHRKKKKTVLRAVFMYLLLSGGSWMFIYSYANSCNHMRGEYMVPAQMVVEDERATVDILGHSAEFSISDIAPTASSTAEPICSRRMILGLRHMWCRYVYSLDCLA
jgi:nitrite reductase/ring-hydroxylating ferredoxin subunit